MTRGLKIALIVALAAVCFHFAVPRPRWVGEAARDRDSMPIPDDLSEGFDLGEILVLLADETRDRHLLVSASFEVDAHDRETLGELVRARRSALRDALIMHLASLSSSELEGDIARFRLKRELRRRVEAIVFPEGEGTITRVSFQKFLIQVS